MIDLNNIEQAILLARKGKTKEAETLYLEMLEKEPDNDIILSAAGLLYISIGNFGKACEYLERAVSIKKSFGNVSALGLSYFEKGDYEKAAEILEESLKLGENEDIYNKLIYCFFQIGKSQKAADYSSIMHQKYPDSPNSTANMVKALTHSGKLIEAETLCVNYLKEHLDSGELWMHLGFLKELIYSDDNQARQCFEEAYKNGQPDALYNIAVSYQKQGNFAEAEKYYNKMLERYPNNPETLTSLGMCMMKQKKFKEGSSLFFNREKTSIDKLSENPWTPDKEFEKEIVILSDQGLGDHIMFARYLPFIKEKTEKLYVAAREPLIKLFKKNYPEYEFITFDKINPKMQSIRITDLAFALNLDFDHIPASNGYLNSEKADIKSNKLKVGLCWEAGSAGIRTMINRTININLLQPFLNLENVQIYSFQVHDSMNGNERFPQMINLAKDFKDFYDTACAIKAMDLIISVDTSVAHLSGALGQKTFLMLPYASDWRWFTDKKTTPWYDSVELFVQNDSISWEKPIEDILCRLKEFSS